MKNLFLFALILAIFTGCGGSAETETTPETAAANGMQEAAESPKSTPEVDLSMEATAEPVENLMSEEEWAEIEGSYVGEFVAEEYNEDKKPSYMNIINVYLNEIRGSAIMGHSVVAGNSRPFKGELSKTTSGWEVVAEEPGDDKYDGKFVFTVKDGEKVEGEWMANDKKLAVTKRKYELEKNEFTYDPDLELPEGLGWATFVETYNDETGEEEGISEDVLKFNASKDLLKKEDIENMYKGDLEVLRNSIYARHGYSFKNRRYRYLFEQYIDWYVPVSTDVRAELTEVEKKNIDLLKRYEQHADRYYDVFGR